ncbi:mucin-15 [Archocentrus centrarchus]|uniref:mucin-15 n=1 Tax=Archocentrus centrarchus TaxID=63155 RepID=UPI0011EA35A3|nr:mucin-15 [Archocentrus centrarchus]
MRLLKLTASLLLLVQAFHLASFQYTTDSPGRTIDKSWLRARGKIPEGGENATVTQGKTEYEGGDMESSNDYSGTASGSMAVYSEEEENVVRQQKSANETFEDLNVTTTTLFPEFQNGTVNITKLPPTTTADGTNSSQINTTGFPDYSNHTNLQSTTLAPESNSTKNFTTTPGLTNSTGPTNTTTLTTTAAPEGNGTSPTEVFPPEIPKTSRATTTAAAPNTPEKVNKTDKAAGSAGSSDRGFAPHPLITKRQEAWGAILGTAVAVAFVGLVAWIILKKKQQKGFSHRKLVEEFPSEPVLRLDNSEPVDLKYGAYYNPALQGDTIQMTNLPGRR